MIEAFIISLLAQQVVETNAQMSVVAQDCYYTYNQSLSDAFFPCGDPLNGHKPCCEGGDNCLANNACYSPYYGTTYLAGCTDPDYEDSSCPDKPNLEDHSWVGLVTCNGVSTDWFACGDNGPSVTHGMGCTCPESSATLAFTAADSPIQNIMNVGPAYGMSSCFPSFSIYCDEATQSFPFTVSPTAATPRSSKASIMTASQTSTPSVTGNSISSSGTMSTIQTTTGPTNTSNPTMAPSRPSVTTAGNVSLESPTTLPGAGLQTQAKIGIGVGSALAVVLVGALLWYCITRTRTRHQSKSALAMPDQAEATSSTDAHGSPEKDSLGDDDPRSPTWSGRKCELPAGIDPRSPTWSGHKSELPADDHDVRSPVPVYEPYRGSYRSSETGEVEGTPRVGGLGREVREGIYEMP